MTEYRQKVSEKVYDREIEARSGLSLTTPYIYLEDVSAPDVCTRVEDVHDGTVNMVTFGGPDNAEFSVGTRLTADQARELASALYEAANVAETWGER